LADQPVSNSVATTNAESITVSFASVADAAADEGVGAA
jgi:hypothetical protein